MIQKQTLTGILGFFQFHNLTDLSKLQVKK